MDSTALSLINAWMIKLSRPTWNFLSHILLSSPNMKKTKADSDEVEKRLRTAKTVRVFGSASDSYRRFIAPRKIQDDVSVKVIMRRDGSNQRDERLKEFACKWHDDVPKIGGAVQLRSVDWSPAMFRGWIFDKDVAIVGLYLHDKITKKTYGDDKECFVIEDKAFVEMLADHFDRIFQLGQEL